MACRSLVTNCSNNYGPYHFPEKLIPLMIINALEGKKLPVYGHGSNVRDWLYVDDHAAALLTVVATRPARRDLQRRRRQRAARNIDVVRAICAHARRDARRAPHRPHEKLIEFVADRPGHDLRYAIDAAKIRRELGWPPRESFASRPGKTVRWYLDNRAGGRRSRSGVYAASGWAAAEASR